MNQAQDSLSKPLDQRGAFFTPLYQRLHRLYPLLVFILVLIIILSFPDNTLMADSAHYYITLTDQFVQSGQFSISTFSSPLRGYLLSLLLWVPRLISEATGVHLLVPFRIFSAAFITLFVVWILPGFFQKLFGFRARLWQNLLLAGLILFFWRGHIAFPLSDFPSLICIMAASLLYLLAFEETERPAWFAAGALFLIGVLLAAATNIRPTYRLTLFIFALLIGFRLAFCRWPVLRRVLAAAALLGGMALVFLPQTMINLRHFETASPFQIDRHGKNNLMMFQLYYGMRMQRIDVGSINQDNERTPMLIVPDPQGVEIQKQFNLDTIKNEEIQTELTLRRYLKMIYRYPFDFATIYLRHLFNGLDQVYPARYTIDIRQNLILYRFVNYTLWFLAIWTASAWTFRRPKSLDPLVLPAAVLLPAFASLPGAVETRFFLPVYIFMYAWVSYGFFSAQIQWKQILTPKAILAYLAFLGLCFAFSASIFAQGGILLLQSP